MLEAKRPMFEYMIRRVLDSYDLDSVEGRAAALREAAPIVADIRDPLVAPYTTWLDADGWFVNDLVANPK